MLTEVADPPSETGSEMEEVRTFLQSISLGKLNAHFEEKIPAATEPEVAKPPALFAMADKFREFAGICVGFPSELITVTSPPKLIHEFESNLIHILFKYKNYYTIKLKNIFKLISV